MSGFRYIPPPRDLGASRVSAARPTPRVEDASPSTELPTQKNVEVVLALGAARYFTFRNRVFCCPPISFPLGQRVLQVYLQVLASATEVAQSGGRKQAESYFAGLRKLARMLWSHVRPARRTGRILRRLHLTKNPFLDASDKEIQELVDFFLQGRMKSNVQFLGRMDPLDERRQTS